MARPFKADKNRPFAAGTPEKPGSLSAREPLGWARLIEETAAAGLQAFKDRCVLWAYCLANRQGGEVDLVEGGRMDTDTACAIAELIRGLEVIGCVGLIPREDGSSVGMVELELLSADPQTLRLGTLAAFQWEAQLTERGNVTPVGTRQ